MSTLIIKPNGKVSQYKDVECLSAIEPPLWAAMMANLDKDSMIVDCEAQNTSSEDLYNLLKECSPLKVDKIIILAIGSHPSANIQQKAEAERLKNMLEEFNIPIEVYSSLPFLPTELGKARWELLYPYNTYRPHNWHTWGREDRETYGVLFSSISCPYNCDFCQVKSFYNSAYKTRSIELFMTDLLEQYTVYGITNFKMMDELFGIPSPHTKDLLEAIIQSGLGDKINIWAYARINTLNDEILDLMKRGGVRWLALGIESGNQAIREEMNKGKFTNEQIKEVVNKIKSYGISVVGNYMFGFYHDTLETMKQTYDLAVELNCEYSNFYCVVAYPDSPLYDSMKKLGVELPKTELGYAQMSYEFFPLATETLSNKEVLAFRDKAFNDYFTSPKYLDYMKNKFGEAVVDEIKKMTDIKIKRKLLE